MIIGGGPAGLQAALQCRRSWAGKSVLLLEAEEDLGYSKPSLPQFMSGQAGEEQLFYWRAEEEDVLLQIQKGTGVQALDPARRTLRLENEEEIRYEKLILAPGGFPLLPPLLRRDDLPGGIFAVRTLQAAREIRKWLPTHRRAVILGAGLVGIKTAAYLRVAGFDVAVVDKEDRLLPQALTGEAARVVEKHFQNLNVQVFLGSLLEDFQGVKGEITAVRVAGKWLPCDTLLIAAGSAPRLAFLQDSGLLENGELLVTPSLKTRDPHIFAAGDAVTIADPSGAKFKPWTWPQAVAQGKRAAENLYLSSPAPILASTHPNSMNLQVLSLAVLGPRNPGSQVLSWRKPSRGVHREIFLHDRKLDGGTLIGDISGAGPLHQLMINREEAAERAMEGLKPASRVYPQSPSGSPPRRRRARILFPEEKGK